MVIGQSNIGEEIKGWKERVFLLLEPPTAEELKEAKEYWIRRCQATIKDELEKSAAPEQVDKLRGTAEPPTGIREKTSGGKRDDREFVAVTGQFKRLAPKQDSEGIWRVGTRMSAHIPFTSDGNPPVLLPSGHRFTMLLMRRIHRECGDGGTDATLIAFRQRGYWVPQGGKLAKKIRNACVNCRKLDAKCLQQPLGPIPIERLLQPVAWGHVELDLCGPFECRGEFNPRSKVKIWGIIMEDKNSGAVHADIVIGYSASAVLAALRRFGSLRGWPAIISSDPGSQLESASGKLESWWDLVKNKLGDFSGKKGFRWDISPANSPWRQGKVERRIGCLKRVIRLALGETRVTQSELQTILFEAASIANERPLSVSGPKEDGSYTIITPNNLLIGRSTVSLPDDTALCEDLSYKDRYHIINSVTKAFWNLWATQCSPKLVDHKKWFNSSQRQLQKDDLVMIADKNALKAKYKLAIVSDVTPSSDGKVRKAELLYHTAGSSNRKGQAVTVTRSVQRLALILGIEEQKGPMCVIDDENSVGVFEKNRHAQN